MAEPLTENPPETRRDTSNQNLDSYTPGQNGNRGGRPRGLAKDVRTLMGGDGLSIAKTMAMIMVDENQKTSDRIAAGSWLADRGWGKAPAFAPVEDTDPLELTDRQADEIAAAFDAGLDELAARRHPKPKPTDP